MTHNPSPFTMGSPGIGVETVVQASSLRGQETCTTETFIYLITVTIQAANSTSSLPSSPLLPLLVITNIS